MTPADLYAAGNVTVVGDCHEWNEQRTEQGYGRLAAADARQVGERVAHRAALALADGPIPDGLNVLHSCDNPPCIRREHLRAGTQAENIRDAVERNRLNGSFQWNREQRLAAGLDGSAARAARWAGHVPDPDETRTCEVCGSAFTRQRRAKRPTRTCSRPCSDVLRARHRSRQPAA